LISILFEGSIDERDFLLEAESFQIISSKSPDASLRSSTRGVTSIFRWMVAMLRSLFEQNQRLDSY